MATNTERVALVTGASSGFGERIAERLTAHDYIVYGTSRRDLPDTDAGVRMRVLDVTDPSSVQACVETILDEVGRIDVLVNNAGIGQLSLAEETAFEDAEALMQTNFFGMARMAQAVLPVMRRQEHGRIIFMSSLSGLIGTPGQAFYSASKHALEGYVEALHTELQHLPLEVVLVEPGFFRTALEDSATDAVTKIDDYDSIRENILGSIRESLRTSGDPAVVAERVVEIVQAESPRLRYRVGSDAHTVPLLKSILPRPLFEFGLHRRFDIHEADA